MDRQDVLIETISVGERHRKDLGDIQSLADSISRVGLLHAVVITPGLHLIAGERRLSACKLLGWDRIPIRVVDLQEIVRGEFAENADRKDFRPSEIDAIRRAMEPTEKAAAEDRMTLGKVSTGSSPGKTRDKIGEFAGVSGRTVEKIAKVVEAAEAEPEKFGTLVEEMDKGSVDGAYKKLKKERRREDMAAAASTADTRRGEYDLYNEDCMNVLGWQAETVDWVITDPPYPKEFLSCYEDLAVISEHILKPGGSLLCMVGQSYLPEIMQALSARLMYHWTLAYLTPGGQSAQLFQRNVNTFWKPVLWFTKGKYEGRWIGDVTKSKPNDNDKNFHHWGQSEGGMSDLMRRFVSPGDSVFDPFMGGGTTGIVAIDLGAKFMGSDSDVDAFNEATVRLSRATLHK